MSHVAKLQRHKDTKSLHYNAMTVHGTRVPVYECTRYKCTRVQVTKLQVTHVTRFQVTHVTKLQVTKSPMIPGYQVTKLPSYQGALLLIQYNKESRKKLAQLAGVPL